MIRERGVVVELKGDVARVALDSRTREQCSHCSICAWGCETREMLVETPAPEGLHVGDAVTVEMSGPGPAGSAALLLFVPLILFVAGLVLAEWLHERGILSGGNGVSVAGGLVLMILGFLAAWSYDRHLRRAPEHQPRIVEWPAGSAD